MRQSEDAQHRSLYESNLRPSYYQSDSAITPRTNPNQRGALRIESQTLILSNCHAPNQRGVSWQRGRSSIRGTTFSFRIWQRKLLHKCFNIIITRSEYEDRKIGFPELEPGMTRRGVRLDSWPYDTMSSDKMYLSTSFGKSTLPQNRQLVV